VSASYGALGSEVAPALAERLGVPFFDRAIPAEVARRLEVPLEAAIAQEEHRPGPIGRLLASFVPLGVLYGAAGLVPETPDIQQGDYRAAVDRLIVELAAHEGGGVLLGRAGAVVLCDHPRAVHVRLDGPLERRIARARARLGADEESVRDSQRASDATREAYVRELYGVDPHDPSLYNLILDTTRLQEDEIVELLVAAVRAMARRDG
jgi:cytidylate kinase